MSSAEERPDGARPDDSPTDEPREDDARRDTEDGDDGTAVVDEASDRQPDESDSEPEVDAEPAPKRSRLRWQAQVAIAVVCLLLGLGLAMQTRLASSADRDLRGARQEDLVRILDELTAREDQLQAEIEGLETTRDELVSGGDQSAVAAQEAQKRADQLAILAGTVAATGPGVVLTITDPKGTVPPEAMIDVIQELRASGAEAIQVGEVRIGTTSAVSGSAGSIAVDGKQLTMPVQVLAIGDPPTMSAAMGIPGGVIATIKYSGGDVTVTETDTVSITALRAPTTPDYAQPADPTD